MTMAKVCLRHWWRRGTGGRMSEGLSHACTLLRHRLQRGVGKWGDSRGNMGSGEGAGAGFVKRTDVPACFYISGNDEQRGVTLSQKAEGGDWSDIPK